MKGPITGLVWTDLKKKETELSTVVCLCCRQNLNVVISRGSFDEYGREMFKNVCRTIILVPELIILLLFGNVVAVAVIS